MLLPEISGSATFNKAKESEITEVGIMKPV